MKSILRMAKQCILIGIVVALFVPMANAAGTSKKCKNEIATWKKGIRTHTHQVFAEMHKILKDEEQRRLRSIDAAYKSKIKQIVQQYKADKDGDKLVQNATELWKNIVNASIINRPNVYDIMVKVREVNTTRENQRTTSSRPTKEIIEACTP